MKTFRHVDTGLYVEEIYVEPVKKEYSFQPMFKLSRLILTDDYEKARRIKNLELCKWMKFNGFYSVEILPDKVLDDIKVIGE